MGLEGLPAEGWGGETCSIVACVVLALGRCCAVIIVAYTQPHLEFGLVMCVLVFCGIFSNYKFTQVYNADPRIAPVCYFAIKPTIMPLGLLQPPVALAHWRTTMPTTTSRSTACHAHPSINPSSEQQPPISIQRRVALLASIAAAAVAPSAYASALGPGLDRAWEAMGGGPADLVFPERFAGIWDVESTLVSVETPLGLEFVPDSRVRRGAGVECTLHLHA